MKSGRLAIIASMYLLKDEENEQSIAWVNLAIIIVNCAVFAYQINLINTRAFFSQYAFVPARFHITDWHSYLPLFTSIFLHGGITHILFNMWGLYVFGDNVEHRVGHMPYLILYLLGGFVASLMHFAFNHTSTVFTIGASGAISAVMGMYFIYFGENTLHVSSRLTIDVSGKNTHVYQVTAWKYIGFWFVSQLVYSLLYQLNGASGGIAWFAHIGGFVFGFLFADLTDKTDTYPWNKHISIKLNNIFKR